MIVRQNCTKSNPDFKLPEKREAAPFETASSFFLPGSPQLQAVPFAENAHRAFS
jgi:hypothetical protein